MMREALAQAKKALGVLDIMDCDDFNRRAEI
jgi:hypothetical protein